MLSPITGFCPFIPGNLTPASRSRDRAELYASIMFDGDPPAIVPLQIVLAALFEEEWPGVKSIQYREAGSRANRPATFYYDPLSIQDPLTWLSAELGCAVINVPIES